MKLFLTAFISLLLSLVICAQPAAAQQSTATRVSGSQVRILTRTSASTTDSLTQADCGKLISYSNSAAIAVTLPAAASLSGGCWMDVQNAGAGTVTIAPTGATIDGGASIALATNQGVRIVDAENQYLTQRGQGQGSSGVDPGAASYSADGATLNLTGTTFSVNTALMATRATVAAGADSTCVVLSGSGTAYVGAMAGNMLRVYTNGMPLRVSIDTTTTGGAITLDCGAGARSVYQNDGASNPTASQWAGGSFQSVVFNGAGNSGAGAWVLQSGGGSASAVTTTTTDTDYTRYFTTATFIGNTIFIANPFQLSSSTGGTGNFNSNGGLTGVLLKAGGGPDYIQWLGRIPSSGWTGAISMKTFWTLQPNSSGQGTGSHTYQAACFTAGSSSTQQAYAFSNGSGAATVPFNFGGGQTYIGTVDSPTLAVPACAANDILILRMTRNMTGTAVDNSVVVYFDVAIPRVVE